MQDLMQVRWAVAIIVVSFFFSYVGYQWSVACHLQTLATYFVVCETHQMPLTNFVHIYFVLFCVVFFFLCVKNRKLCNLALCCALRKMLFFLLCIYIQLPCNFYFFFFLCFGLVPLRLLLLFGRCWTIYCWRICVGMNLSDVSGHWILLAQVMTPDFLFAHLFFLLQAKKKLYVGFFTFFFL